ncbi:MAG: DUF1553 domain-containing protein [Planctomycetes bacterium]|nr:DUF1553 domain-containing protein [Planctomycetota bacterium]
MGDANGAGYQGTNLTGNQHASQRDPRGPQGFARLFLANQRGIFSYLAALIPNRSVICFNTPTARSIGFVLLSLGIATSSLAVTAQPIDFNRQIRPILSNNCLICHGPDEAERASELRLDSQDSSRIDLGGYAAIVPGDSQASEIVARLISDDDDLRMPPPGKGRQLTTEEVKVIRKWIDQGAAYATHWSYENPTRPPLPSVNQPEWPKNAIDYFVLAQLEGKGLGPSDRAGRLTIARRVSLDLTGLPPTWEEAQAFAADQEDNAYERYVDRLLAKPAFGERWARVWLDLARYADSAGYADDPPRTIWAFRDYVIRALNENKPFDEFTIEQIAGDLLENPTENQLIATAFHRNTMTNNEGGTNDEEFRNVAIVDRVNTTMAVWMGTTMACAQCHTHKFDPITQEEYFQFFAFFNNSKDADLRAENPFIQIWSDEQESQKTQWRKRIAELKKTLETTTPELETAQAKWLDTIQVEPEWTALIPDSATAENRKLVADENGWISATGEKREQDCYTLQFPTTEGQLSGLRLDISPSQQENFVLSQLQASWMSLAKEMIDARFVRIELPGEDKIIHLAEVQVFSKGKNIALMGQASQSSTSSGGKVEYAIDGNTDGQFNSFSVTHTSTEKDPWLEIDLRANQPIDRVVLWNRTDGGGSIAERLAGFRLVLLDGDRKVVWQRSPSKVPYPHETYAVDGSVELDFAAAYADYSQSEFPALSVLQKSVGEKTGWAIGGQTGQPHELTLILRQPRSLGQGTLTVQLNQVSKHSKHLLDHFRLAMTADERPAYWAQMSAEIRKLVREGSDNLNDEQRAKISGHYLRVTPLLAPTRKELAKLEKQLNTINPYTTVPVMRDLAADKHRITKMQMRGNYQSTGKEVSEATPAAFHPLPTDRPRDRLALARWLIDENNPLTPRVIANRHWEQIFGIGIVETSEEFGSQGELPSHPDLLDWLAVELRDSGWDLKHLLKLLVTSATYRQNSITSSDQQEIDPQNRLLARGPRFRISAEMIRDQALFVSGLLSDKMYGNPVNPPQPKLGLSAAFGETTDWNTSEGDDRYRRGIYTRWRRSNPYPSMAQFDAPNREVCTIRRIRTNTPLQALVTLNDPVYVEAAQALARRMVSAGNSAQQRIEYGFHVSLTRDPAPEEVERLIRLVETVKSQFQNNVEQATLLAVEPLGKLPEKADAAELAAWTVVGNVILNLDEVFLKR